MTLFRCDRLHASITERQCRTNRDQDRANCWGCPGLGESIEFKEDVVAKGTCNICNRSDLELPSKGQCGRCYDRIKKGKDPLTGKLLKGEKPAPHPLHIKGMEDIVSTPPDAASVVASKLEPAVSQPSITPPASPIFGHGQVEGNSEKSSIASPALPNPLFVSSTLYRVTFPADLSEILQEREVLTEHIIELVWLGLSGKLERALT